MAQERLTIAERGKMDLDKRYWRYWGKARKQDESGAPYHLLPYHCLDVAAVGVVYLSRAHRFRRFLASSMSLTDEALTDLFGFLLALHDLGKFSGRFQGQREDLQRLLQLRSCRKPYTVRHDSLGYAYWQQYLWPWLKQEPVFVHFGKHDGLNYWASAVMGHHGKPPVPHKSATNQGFVVTEHFDPDDLAATAAFSDSMREIFWNETLDRCLSSLDSKAFVPQSRTCSWWLAGLTILADWLGSNKEFFPYRSEPSDLGEYWDYAQHQAEVAIARTDLLPAMSAPHQMPETLFEFLKDGLTPLQSVASELSVAQAPQLFILEDVTGAGKTEAAVLLANRLMAAGQADGIYFALPTMATSNAMYSRIKKVYRRLFTSDATPSLVLAHGAARLSARFNASVIPIDDSDEDDRVESEKDSASARCNAWFADHRKKALLAHVGVGTIDQGLLGILHSRHQSLRVLGLFGKLVIVDEVHACDAYMLGLLEKLLTLHARGGGSALLLSATLPLSTRRKLVNAFRKGLGLEIQPLQSMAYPLLTHIHPSQAEPQELPVATRPEVAREVVVDCFSDETQVIDELIRTLQAGSCACWIRNTVTDALATYAQLLPDGRFDASRIHLFHARFTAGDRLRIEEAALARFGKEPKAEHRAGHLMIATQVVEQSLDVDFDLLVTDLAPIDLLIQRAGRLRRHARDINGNPLPAGSLDQRGVARMIVFGPLAGGEVKDDWYQGFFAKGAAVYPDHGQLWLTADLLQQRPVFRMPEDARRLIEGVYGEDAESNIPEPLLGKFFDAEAERLKQKSAAKYHAIDLSQGYRAGEDKWWEDNIALTRLGEETHSLLLARWQNGLLLPWHGGEDGWHLSEIRVRKALLAEVLIEAADLTRAIEELNPSLPGKGKWSVLLPLTETEGIWRCSGIDGKRRNVQVSYSAEEGLKVEA